MKSNYPAVWAVMDYKPCDTWVQRMTFDQGLQVTGRQRVSAWDILEGHKNPAPLSLAWFGAIRQERKVLKYEEHFR